MPPPKRPITRTGRGPPISRSTGSDRRHGLVASFGYAFEGCRSAWISQRNFRIHVVLTAAALAGGALLRLPAAAWAVLVLAIGLVLVAELLNTAIEAAVDLASPAEHPLAKRAKDIAAAAVVVAAASALLAGACIVVWAVRRT
ncbi:MAG TPA: diacylglycerol kinase family protein [Candidatus Elarobacter sp.]|jgi:diacylglycerol kinase (ATP)